MSRTFLIINPISGRGAGGCLVPQAEALLRAQGVQFDRVLTERPWHAAELAQQAAASGLYDAIVAMGGDGTANEVLNGLMLARQAGATTLPALGVLCVGRGNDFAFGMGMPPDLAAGVRAIAAGRRKTVDVGRVTGGLFPQGRYFGNGIGIGFDAVVGFVAAKMKRLSGFPSYIVAALKTIFLYYRAPLVKVVYDGQAVTAPALMVSVMNGRRMGGGFMMAPTGDPQDGLFDLCIAREVSRPAIFALIPRFMAGTQATHPAITTARAAHVTVTALKGSLPAHGDGETLCTEGERLMLELLPQQIEVIYSPEGVCANCPVPAAAPAPTRRTTPPPPG